MPSAPRSRPGRSRARADSPVVPPPLQGLDSTPLAAQARNALLAAILSDEFEDRLPPEDELARMLNVSRTTVRAALNGLERDGLIRRRRAVGTTINRHVKPSTLALQRLVGFDWLLREQGHETVVAIDSKRGRPPADLLAIFPLEPEADVLTISKTYLADGVMAIALRDVVPWEQIAVDPGSDDIDAALFEFSQRHCRQPIDHAVVQLVPMVMRRGVTRLDLASGTPFVRLHETHYAATASPIAYSMIDVNDLFVKLEVFRRRS
jgi:GntR family transcriptional regulator